MSTNEGGIFLAQEGGGADMLSLSRAIDYVLWM